MFIINHLVKKIVNIVISRDQVLPCHWFLDHQIQTTPDATPPYPHPTKFFRDSAYHVYIEPRTNRRYKTQNFAQNRLTA